jgi:glucose-1-phosphate adenylyltransferase
MNQAIIGDGCVIEKAIIDENTEIGNNIKIGTLPEKENDTRPDIYNSGLVTIGEKSVIPSNVTIGKNAVITGKTVYEDYRDGILDSGSTLIKVG